MILTRREKHTLIILAIVALAFIIFKPDQSTVKVLEYFGLFFLVFPSVIYVSSDPECKKEGK